LPALLTEPIEPGTDRYLVFAVIAGVALIVFGTTAMAYVRKRRVSAD